MNNGRTKNGITHCTMKILHGRRTNVKCTEARLQKEEMECNKVKLELKQEYQALNNHTLNVATLHDACKQVKSIVTLIPFHSIQGLCPQCSLQLNMLLVNKTVGSI